MIFVILDYITYKLGKGKYSKSEINKQGGMLLTEELINKLEPNSEIIFHRRDSFLSWIICYYSSSLWSHVSSLIDNHNLLDVTTAGVIEHPLNDYADGKTFIIVFHWKGIEGGIFEKVNNQMRKEFLGRPYGWFKVFRIFIYTITAKKKNFFRIRFLIDIFLIWLLLYSVLPFKLIMILFISLYLVIVVKNVIIYQGIKIRF
jgi:hypothetical protein